MGALQKGPPFLGGRFDPEKKYLAPPPKKIPQFAADTLPAPRPPPPGNPKHKEFMGQGLGGGSRIAGV